MSVDAFTRLALAYTGETATLGPCLTHQCGRLYKH
ncbi:hypothetical protein BOH78_2544 [Pichia kudriavzevii]|uniref:Uncharacterized protein n=1 Tax=Pichia kudriavzevii TaxID=4909 RepID=A0A099NR46_PICKU|nr:hypothetical protein JL09_g5831 [Pichia kudriavzevii]ONH74283.1 hypothetical protein BOH78_2544 [Pichia kudriavzevii]